MSPPLIPLRKAGARLRVVIDGRFLTDHYPGIGRYIFNLAGALPAVAPDYAFGLLVDRSATQTRFNMDQLAARGIEIVFTDTSVRSFCGQIETGMACRRLSPDVFHATHLLSAGRVPCASVATIYDVIPLHPSGRLPALRHRALYRLLLRRALSSATAFTMLSEAAARELVTRCGVARARITVTPAGVDDAFRPAPPAEVAALRQRLCLPERYALYVGTNKPHKNLGRMVEAWFRLRDARDPGAQLVIAGPEDPRHADARRLAADAPADAVRFLGTVAERDLRLLYSGAHVLVHPSLCEGFGLPVLEAMACGVPVVCARTPALDEVVGPAAYQFDPTSVDDMAAALARGLGDPVLRAELVSRGFERVRAFSWSRTALLTADAYTRACLARVPGLRAS